MSVRSNKSVNDPQPSNQQLAAEYMAEVQKDLADAEALIAQLKQLMQKADQDEITLAEYSKLFGPNTKGAKQLQAIVDQDNANIKNVEDQLNQIDPGLGDFDAAIAALENGVYTVAYHGDRNIQEDIKMFTNYLNTICDAMLDHIQCYEVEKHMSSDGDDINALLQDAMKAIQYSSEENGELEGLQIDMENDLVTLNNQKNVAQVDANNRHWYDDALTAGKSGRVKKKDREIIHNSDDMRKIILGVMTDLIPEMAAAQNEVYETASLTMQKIMDRVLKIFEDPTLSPQQKADQIKVLLALALGILAQIEAIAGEQKSKNQQTESKSATFAVQMNIADQQAKLKQLEDDLKYANTMKQMMKIAKPMIEVGGALLAPGVGSFLIMAAFIVLDNTGLTDKLTASLAKAIGSKIGAEILVGAMEVVTTMGGGAALDRVATQAVAKVAAVVAEEVNAMVAKTVSETVESVAKQAGEDAVKLAEKEAANSGRALTQVEIAQIKKEATDKASAVALKVVQPAVENAAKLAIEKTVQQFNNQAASTLIWQLLKTGYKEGTLNLSTMMAKAAEENCKVAAEEAAKIAAEDVQFFVQAAVNGADVTDAMIADVSNKSANEAVAKITQSTAEKVGVATERSTASKALSRAGWTAAYAALSDGSLSAITEAILKKAHKHKDDNEWQKVMMVMKMIEQILASLTVMYGSGVFQSVVMEGSSTTLLKLGAISQIAGTATQGVSLAGQADAETRQAGAVKGINEESVSNEMLQMFLQQFKTQGDIDEKHLQDLLSEQSSNYTVISQLENSGNALARVLATQAV